MTDWSISSPGIVGLFAPKQYGVTIAAMNAQHKDIALIRVQKAILFIKNNSRGSQSSLTSDWLSGRSPYGPRSRISETSAIASN